MPPPLDPQIVNALDLRLAWLRARRDDSERTFVRYPSLHRLIELNLDDWLAPLRDRLTEGYVPQPARVAEVPKPHWMVRPGAVLELNDQLVYAAVVGAFLPSIRNFIGPFQGDPDVAYQLNQDTTAVNWIRSDVRIWTAWREGSSEKLGAGIRYMVSADLAGFYENIDLQRLLQDLRSLELNISLLDLLSRCLNRWGVPRSKGIPQGYSPSDLLAKVYLNPVDLGLQNSGIVHLRYVDDIRIFCGSYREAKLALLKLNELIRGRGLNLQSAKTKILPVDDARAEIAGTTEIIEGIQTRLQGQILAEYGELGPYFDLAQIEHLFAQDAATPPPEVLEEAFNDYFVSREVRGFDKTLFHFLLARLGKTRSKIAVEYCMDQLLARPEETEPILRYLRDVELSDLEVRRITNYLGSADAIYDYQLYRIVEWFSGQNRFPDQLVQICRGWAFDRNRPEWLRTWAIAILGAAGNRADLDSLEHQYANATSDLERAEITLAIRRTDPARRNAFFARVREDGELVRRAAQLARTYQPPAAEN